MRGSALLLLPLLLLACGDSGPDPSEIAAMKAKKDCSKLYAGMSKVVSDMVRKKGVAANLGEKDGFVELCVKQDFKEPELKCMDPNLGGTEECKKTLEPVEDKVKALQEYLLAPMTKKDEKKEEGDAEKKEGEK